jgi:hypothetical protein
MFACATLSYFTTQTCCIYGMELGPILLEVEVQEYTGLNYTIMYKRLLANDKGPFFELLASLTVNGE